MAASARKRSWLVMRAGLVRHLPLIMLGVLLYALALRVAVVALFANFDPASAVLWEYGEMARAEIAHGWMARTIVGPDGVAFTYPSAYMPPGYVFVWMAAFKIFGDTPEALMAVTLLNILCSVAIVWLTARLAEELTGDRLVAVLAAVIVATYPTFVYSVVTYHALNAYTAVFLAALLLIMQQARAADNTRLIVIGLLGGVAALLRSEFVLVMGALYITLWIVTRRTRDFVVLVLLSALVVGPWTLRNYTVFDRVIPVASSVGYNLWKGHNPAARGSGDEIEKTGAAIRQLGDKVAAVPHDRNFEIAVDSVFRDAAIQHIKTHPVETFVLGLKKNLLFWLWEAYDPISWQLAYLIPHVITTALTVFGLVLAFRHGIGGPALFIVAVVVIQSLINAAFSVHVRYRMTIEPILFVYAAVALVALARSAWFRQAAVQQAEVLALRQPAAPGG